jgi:exosortase
LTTAALSISLRRAASRTDRRLLAQSLAASLAFLLLFAQPITKLVRDWWFEADAGHGLLLAPLAVYLAWRAGIAPAARQQRVLGSVLLVIAICLRYAGGMAAELLTMRTALLLAILGLIIFHVGLAQVRHWWLPIALLVLSIPLPVMVLGSIALPLQMKASQLGAALLEWRQVPVRLNGNVIYLPGRTLFVTEACSGLRSLASLLSLGVLIGGLWLRWPVNRLLLVLLSIPVAILLNGIRVFLTGFLVYFVDPALGEGFMHLTEGWIIFVVAFAILAGISWVLVQVEALRRPEVSA